MRTAVRAACLICCFITLAVSSFAVTYYTYVNGGSSGFWNNAGTWTTDPSGMSLTGSAVPGNGDVVYILNGYTVNLNANVTTTNLSINILNGGVLNLSTYTFGTLNALGGSGTLRIGSGYFPSVVTNTFSLNAASGATVEFTNFTGALPGSINYPNLLFSNSTATNHTISIPNTAGYNLLVSGNLTTQATGSGTLTVLLGTQATNKINLTVQGNVTIGAGTTFGVGTFNANHTITLYGNLTNNGTVDLSNSGQYTAANNGSATLTFTGTTNNVMTCNGTTDLYTLTVDKGSGSTYILSVTSTNSANLKFFSNGQLIDVVNGTLRLGANIDIPRVYGTGTANYNLGSSTASPMLWIDGADFNTNSNALVVYGKFRITAGTFTCVGREGTVIREEGQYLIEGGTFTTEKFRPSNTDSGHRGSFTMTGGTFNVVGTASNNNYARFSIPYAEQVFIMSGGTINVHNPQAGGGGNNGGIHIGCKESNYNVTGGSINAILSGSAASFNVSSTAPFWNFTISRTGGTPTTVRLAAIGGVGENSAQPLRVLNDFTIEGTNSPVFDANGQDVSIGGNFILNSGGTYNPNGNTTLFNGTGDQTFTNNGTITSGLYNLTMDKPSGALLISGTNASLTITQTLHLENGVFNDGGKTIVALGSIYNAAVHTGTGSIRLQGTSTQTISGDGTGVFGNMWLNNSSNPGATATADIAISGTLTLAGGTSYFDINENLLALTSTSASAVTTSGSSFGASKMVRTSGYQSDRGVRKTFGNTTAFTFPVGVGTIYTPATIQLTAAPTTYGTITVRPVNARHPLVAAGNTSNLMWYWKITSSGFTGVGANGVSHTFRYQEAQVVPANSDVNYVPARYHPTSWTVINNTNAVDQGTNTISFTNVGYIDGEFTAGVPAAFGIVRIFYSKRSGDWSDTSPGTTPWSNVSHTGPDATSAPTVGDHVYIGDGSTHNHTITITANNQAAGGLEINSGSTLDLGVTTGHNFGTLHNTQVGGSGRLRISSSGPVAQFPGGDFGNFIRESGGTVEYYTTGNQSFVIPKTSAAPTNLPLKSYRHLIVAPGAGRTITLPDENLYVYGNVTVDGNASGLVLLNSTASRTLTVAGNLTIASGVLRFENVTPQTVEVLGDLTVNSAGQFTLSTSGTVVTNELILHGSMVNNGVFDMAVMGGHICNTTFKGNANATVTGTGPNTEFNVLTVDKGSSIAPILDVNLNSFSLAGTPSPLVLVSGTFRLSSAQSVTIASNTDFNIPSQARLSANGGTFHITGPTGTDLLLAGTLEVLNGTVNVGTSSNDNSIEYAATGQPTISISGGTLNVRSQIRRSAASSQGSLVYNQSGGVVNAGISTAPTTTRGVFEILNPGSSFTMSGGTLSIGQPSNGNAIADLYLQPAAYAVTGGTVQIGTGALSRTVDVNSAIPLYNFEVTGSGNTTRLEANGLTLLGSLTIQASDVFNAAGYNVSIAGNFTNLNTNNGTGTAIGGYQAGSATQTTTLNGSANHQVFTGTAGNLTNFANLIVNNTFAGGAVNVQPNSNIRVNGMLTLSNGTLAGSTNTITVIGNVSNSAVHTSSGTGSITLAGSSTQIITGNGNGKFGNLTLNNASGATFGANQEVTGTLTFVNGSLNIGAYGLNLSSTSLSSIAGYSASRYIITGGNISDVGVTKAFASSVTAGVFEFPIGVSGKYTPAHYTITTGASGGTIRIKPVNSKHPNATGSGTAFIRYYWSVTNNGVDITSLTHTYTYVAADENGDPTDYRDARFQGGAWTIGVTAGNPNSTTRVIVFTNVNLTGDYTAGEQTAFLNPQTYTSIASGDWESDAVWDVDPPGNGLGPPPGSFVVISEGHTVTVTTSTRRTATLEVRGRLHLGTTTGHEFGTVSSGGTGDKTIQIQSSTFPSGNFSPFVAAGGGTIEYNGAVTLPTQTTYNNLTFTGAGTKTLPNVDLVLNGTLTIVQGTVTNAVNNRNIELAGSGQHFVNNGTFHMGTGEITIGGNLTNSGASAVFNAGNGDDGLHILGSLSNISGATFNAGTDSVGVRGSLLNEGTFNAGAGMMRIRNNLTNVSGAFNGGAGAVTIRGSLTNNAAFTAGTGTMTVTATFTNTGAGATYASGSGALVVSGNFVNGPSATFDAGSGSVMLSGNWSNSGTFNSGTGSVTFESNGVQTLTGTTAFYRLNRSNGGSLQLNSDITVSDQLVFSSGKIVTGSNTVELTNTASQPVSGYGNTAFIDGRVSIAYPNTAGASRVFPVGKGNVYRPVVIQQTAASTSPVVRVEMINTPPTGTYPVEVGVLSEARYYAIDLVSGTMNAPTVELNFNTNSTADENVLFAGNAHIMRATNSTGPWTDEGGSGVFSPAAPTGYATSGVTSIASQTFFTLGYQNVILPVELSAFSGYLENGVVELFWTTLSEENNDYFTIERSGVELHFDSIGFVSGAGNSNVKLHYRYSDLNPLDGVSYYRLKQTDFDGQVIYSRTITIKSHFEEPVLSVYPNPARSGEPVYVRLDYSKEKDVMLSVADMSGRTHFSGVVDLSSTVELNDIVRANLSPGTYVLRFMLRGALFTQKIIVY